MSKYKMGIRKVSKRRHSLQAILPTLIKAAKNPNSRNMADAESDIETYARIYLGMRDMQDWAMHIVEGEIQFKWR